MYWLCMLAVPLNSLLAGVATLEKSQSRGRIYIYIYITVCTIHHACYIVIRRGATRAGADVMYFDLRPYPRSLFPLGGKV